MEVAEVALCLQSPNATFLVGNASVSCRSCAPFRRYVKEQSSQFSNQRAIANMITSAYIIISLFGAVSNGLVMFAMARCPQLRNLRNYFILNLAVSDFLMCTLTAPFTLYVVLNNFWPFGDVACGLMSAAQGISIIVSSLSLTGIGLDRYILIIFPTRVHGHSSLIIAYLIFVWIIAVTICLPYFIATATVGIEVLLPHIYDYFSPCGESFVRMCVPQHWEKLPFGKTDYTISIMLIQYLFPLCTLFLIYYQIGRKIARRGRAQFASNRTNGDSNSIRPANGGPRRGSVQAARQRRTLWLLTALVINFAVLWLPLNIYNVLIDFEIAEWDMTRFAYCHLFGMLTACTNPVLYGLLNENFRVEYIQMLTSVRRCIEKHCLCYLLNNIRKPAKSDPGCSRKTMLTDCNAQNKAGVVNGHLTVSLLNPPSSANDKSSSSVKNYETTMLLGPESTSSTLHQSIICEDKIAQDPACDIIVEEDKVQNVHSSSWSLTILNNLGLEDQWEPKFIDDDEEEMKSIYNLTPDSVPLVSAEVSTERNSNECRMTSDSFGDRLSGQSNRDIFFDREPAYL